MSVTEKLQIMEQLWETLSDDNQEVQSPDWHAEILKERREKINSGKANFHSLDKVKEKFRR